MKPRGTSRVMFCGTCRHTQPIPDGNVGAECPYCFHSMARRRMWGSVLTPLAWHQGVEK